jgi:hypothetical protein
MGQGTRQHLQQSGIVGGLHVLSCRGGRQGVGREVTRQNCKRRESTDGGKASNGREEKRGRKGMKTRTMNQEERKRQGEERWELERIREQEVGGAGVGRCAQAPTP